MRRAVWAWGLLAAALGAQTAVVPVVGCPADGQAGPVEAPEGISIRLSIGRDAATGLAYYRSGLDMAALAPRGWHCLGIYGSGGDSLVIRPEPVDWATTSSLGKTTGPVVLAMRSLGETSGRFIVAEMIARLFPEYRSYIDQFVKAWPDMPRLPTGPFPGDRLTYRSATTVEYRTPKLREGLGTFRLAASTENPIDGVVMLVGKDPDLLHLAVRLQPDQVRFKSAIIAQFERDAVKLQ